MRVIGMEHKPIKKVETPKVEEPKENNKNEKVEEPKKFFRKED